MSTPVEISWLLTAVGKGNATAFESLYSATCAKLYGVVLRIQTVAPWRVTRVVWRSGFVVEAAAGAFERWQLRPGDTVEVKE